VEGGSYGFVRAVCGGFVSLHNARLEGDSSTRNNARGLSMIFVTHMLSKGLISRIKQGVGLRSDCNTYYNTSPPVHKFITVGTDSNLEGFVYGVIRAKRD